MIESQLVFTHEVVLGELLVGMIKDRRATLTSLLRLPRLENAAFPEVLWFVEQQELSGKGLSWNDIHLLCTCILSGAKLYTTDLRLHQQAQQLRVTL